MATFTGQLLDVALTSDTVHVLPLFTTPAEWAQDLVVDGTDVPGVYAAATRPVPTFGLGDVNGLVLDGAGTVRFDRIHVRFVGAAFGAGGLRDFGNLLDGVTAEVEVWNAYRVPRTLTVISVTEGAGVSVTDPYGTPLDYGPSQSYVYEIDVAIAGPARVDAAIVFDFAGIAEPSAVVAGVRLVPFAYRPHWRDGIAEGFEWLTDIFVAEDGSEQRRRVRSSPRRRLAFTVDAMGAAEAAAMEALLYGWLHLTFGVPQWQHAMRLAVSVGPGDTVVTVADIANREIVAGQTVLLWTGARTWEARTVDAIEGVDITLTDALTGTWPAARALVLPVRVGSLAAEIDLQRLDGWTRASVDFLLNAEAAS